MLLSLSVHFRFWIHSRAVCSPTRRSGRRRRRRRPKKREASKHTWATGSNYTLTSQHRTHEAYTNRQTYMKAIICLPCNFSRYCYCCCFLRFDWESMFWGWRKEYHSLMSIISWATVCWTVSERTALLEGWYLACAKIDTHARARFVRLAVGRSPRVGVSVHTYMSPLNKAVRPWCFWENTKLTRPFSSWSYGRLFGQMCKMHTDKDLGKQVKRETSIGQKTVAESTITNYSSGVRL